MDSCASLLCLTLTICKIGAYLVAHGCAKRNLRLVNVGSPKNMLPLITTGDKIRDLEERLERSEAQQGKLMVNLAETQRLFYVKQNGVAYPDVQVVR